MGDSNAYYADPARIQGGVRQMNQISALVEGLVGDFVSSANLTRDWCGENDSMAKELIPQEKKERDGSIDTGRALSEAVVGVVNGTNDNVKNILTTQGGNLDAIRQSAGGGGHRPRH